MILNNWKTGYHNTYEKVPDNYIKATIPGAVQLDVSRHEKYPPYYYGESWKKFRWMEDVFFTYVTNFDLPQFNQSSENVYLVAKGIDFKFDILLNDQKIVSEEGMYQKVDLNITKHLKNSNEIKIILYPVPKSHKNTDDKTQADQTTKPASSYGWDWHPRLIPSGIWDDIYIEVRNKSHISEICVNYVLNDQLDSVKLNLSVSGEQLINHTIEWNVLDKNAKKIIKTGVNLQSNTASLETTLDQIELWYPHDMGEQVLYLNEIKLIDPDGHCIQKVEEKTGFRKTELIMNAGAWDEPDTFPKTRSIPPVTFKINNQIIFAKGTNWVQPDIFYGRLDDKIYEDQIKLIKDANLNMIRVWGGGPVNKDRFFELCDENGILVWQEFPLACNDYKGSENYLKLLKKEAISILKRTSKHPCIAMYCGGNELFNRWSGMTDQHLALRLLNNLSYQYDRDVPYIMTAPVMGMGHGHYVFRDDDTGEDVFELMNRSRFSAYSEFGLSSPASVETLKKIIPEDELWPPIAGTSWETHSGFNAWQGDTWLRKKMLEYYFGPSDNLDELVNQGQLMQSIGYKYIFEEARRQKPYCSMALNWCFNEPWPTAANCNVITYPLEIKPAYYAIQQACRPTCTSARFQKFEWKGTEEFNFHLWLLNDSSNSINPLTINAFISINNTKKLLLTWKTDSIEPSRNLSGPTVRYVLPDHFEGVFSVILECEENEDLNSTYDLLVKPSEIKTEQFGLNA